MFIESGVIIFIGLLLLAIKLPLKVSLKLLNHGLAVDVVAAAGAYVLHWGTFSGVMAAAVAGLMCSAFTAGAKWTFGYIAKNRYYPGQLDLSTKLKEAKS